jgi:hypothetical protein
VSHVSQFNCWSEGATYLLTAVHFTEIPETIMWWFSYLLENMRSALFRDFTQRRMVASYRCFGTTYQSHIKMSSSLDCLTLEDGTGRLSRNFSKKLPLYDV